MSIEIIREGNHLIAKGSRNSSELEEAVQAFVANEINQSEPCLLPEDIEKVMLDGNKLTWHPRYNRFAWPDANPPLEVLEVWRSEMLGKNVLILYRCENKECVRCHKSFEGLSFHLKLIRPDGFDAFGSAVEIETKRGKAKVAEIVNIDQPVFSLNGLNK